MVNIFGVSLKCLCVKYRHSNRNIFISIMPFYTILAHKNMHKYIAFMDKKVFFKCFGLTAAVGLTKRHKLLSSYDTNSCVFSWCLWFRNSSNEKHGCVNDELLWNASINDHYVSTVQIGHRTCFGERKWEDLQVQTQTLSYKRIITSPSSSNKWWYTNSLLTINFIIMFCVNVFHSLFFW